jgi:CheY-like chemotaxis protein
LTTRTPLVLVCDDDPWVRATVRAIVDTHGYRVIVAESGVAAVATAARERPDVILLDLMMPGMDGWATAAALRRQATTSGIPVVIVSALSRVATDPVAAEVVAWLEKPLDVPALMEALRDAVGSRL